MFLFESSKDKELKKIIETKFNEAISSQTKYEANKQMISSYCSNSDKKSIQKFVDLVKQTIKDDDVSPKSKYYAIQMLQDVAKTRNNALGNYIVKKILKRLVIFAEYKKQSKDEKRGRSIFGKVKPDQQNYANKFHLTVLSCLQEWGTTWPKGMEGPHLVFKQKYEELMKQKVTFPKTINNAPEALKQKISKDKIDLKAFNQPKKFISPDRRQSRDKKDSDFNSGTPQPLSQNKIIEINTFMLRVDENFNVLEAVSLEETDANVITPVITQLRSEMAKGDQYVAELMSYNQKEFEPVINDIIADFEFIQEIQHDVGKLLKTEKGKRQFVAKYKTDFQKRRQRRNQNELRASILNKQMQKNKSFEGNNSMNSRKSEQKQPNFYYPQTAAGENNPRSSFGQKNIGDSVTMEDLKKKSDRESERSRKQSVTQSVSEDQPTGKFKTFRQQEVTDKHPQSPFKLPEPPIQVKNVSRNSAHLDPREATSKNPSDSEKDSESQSMNNSSAVPTPPPIRRELTKPPTPPSLQAPSSSENIHSTSIMKKFESSNLINQSNSNSNSKQKSGFSSSQNPFGLPFNSNPIKSNPFQSNEAIKKQFQSNNMFSSFGKSSLRESSKNESNAKPKQTVYGKIEENAFESDGNLTDRKKIQKAGNPFDDESILSVSRQKTNPFDESVQHQFQSMVSNPFTTQKSFMQKSNPFLSNSISSANSQVNVAEPNNNIFQKSNLDKSAFQKNNSSFSNLFVKKSKLDINFDIEEDQKKSDTSQIKPELKQSDFIIKRSLKDDFFSDEFAQKAFEKADKNNASSFFDPFNVAPNQMTNIVSNRPADEFFGEIKASKILSKKDMTTSNLEFNWFEPQKKPSAPENPIPQVQIYPEFSQRQSKIDQQEYNKNMISLNQFNPPEIDLETTPKQSKISQPPNKDISNPWPEIDDLNISEFPIKEPSNQINQTYNIQINNQNENEKKDYQNANLSNQQQIGDQSKRSKQYENPFGLPNPQFQNSTFQKNKKPDPSSPFPQQFQMPTTDKDQFLFENFRAVVKEGGSPWNPYKKKSSTSAPSPQKSKPIFKFQVKNLEQQVKQAKQVYQRQLSANQTLQQQVLAERIEYNAKLKQIEMINIQKQQYQNLVKKSKQTIAIQEFKIAEQSKTINKLKALKDRKNDCLKKLFELQSQRYSVKSSNKQSRSTSSKVNKFMAFNQTAKRLGSLATSNRNLNVKDTFKMTSFHHKH